MALQNYTVAVGNLIDDGAGRNYAVDEPVYIKTTGGALAPIFRDEAGTSPIIQDGIANLTNQFGEFSFYVESGEYIIESAGNERSATIAGSDYFNNQIEIAVNQIIEDTAESRGFRVVGAFADGFDYELPNDVGINTDGTAWIYVGSDPLPVTVAPGTDPTASSDYLQVTFSDHSATTNRDQPGGHESSAIYKIIGDSAQGNQRALTKYDEQVSVSIPSDYPDLQSAFDDISTSPVQGDKEIVINIESGHNLTGGFILVGGDYSNCRITSDDAVVSLSGSFVGVDATPVPVSFLGESPKPPLAVGYKCKMPTLDCVIDMNKLYGSGWVLAEAEGTITPDSGVINAGFRGLQVHGRANAYGANFSGAVGSALRIQQASSCCANDFNGDNSMTGVDGGDAAIYVSRSSTLEFRYGSAQNSGANGLTARRSIVTADDANFDGAALQGVRSESLSQVSCSNSSILGSTSSALNAIAGANIYAVGAALSTTSSAKEINTDVGGVVQIAGSTTVGGVNATEASVFTYSNVKYTNTFDSDGMVFFDSANGTFKVTSNADGISQRFADGRMLTFISTTVDTGTVASGNFSAQLTMPTQPDTFVSVQGSSMNVVGRSSAGGGGVRVCVDNYYRPNVLTGSAWRVRNSGQELDGSGTGLNCASVDVHMITYGTWR